MPSREQMIAELDADDQKSAMPSREQMIAEMQSMDNDEQSAMPEAEAALQGLGKEATFGYLPEIQAGVYQGLETGADALGLLPEGFETESYDQTLAGMEGRQDTLQEQSPYAFGAGQIAGTFAGPGAAMIKGAGRLAKGSGTIANLAKGSLGQGAIGQRIAGGASVAGAEGAIYNPEEGQSRIENAALSAGLGGFGAEAVSLGLRGAGSLLKGIGKAPGWVGKKTMTTILGAEERNIKKYLDNPDLINNAKTFEEVKDRLDDMIRPIRQELADAQIDEKEALVRLKETERIISGEFKDKGKELRAAFSSAKDRLSRANKSSIDTMNRVLPPLHLTDAVVDSLDNLKTQVKKGSSDALDELQREVKTDLNINEANEVIESVLDNMTVGGRILDHDSGAAKQIKAISDDLEAYAGVMSPYDIKKYIKSLDRAIDISDVAGTFNDSPTQAKVALRRYLDSVIKEASPSYAAFMTAVADDMQTLTQARRYFGTPDKAAKKLSSIMSPTNREARESLLRLAERTGADFKTPLMEYQSTKNLLVKQKMEAAARGEFDTDLARDLGAWQDYDVAKNQLTRFNERSTQKVREIQERLVSRSQAAEQAELAVQRSKDAKEAAEALGNIYESNSEDKIRRLVSFFNSGEKGKGFAVRQEFEKLSALEDEDFVQMIEALGAAGSFDKSFLRGSRNVNLWGAMTMAAQSGMSSRGGAGGVIGGILGGPVGIGIGAAWGAVIDQYGPKMAKNILDQVIRIKGLPTVQKIAKLNLPQNVKDNLTKQMRAFIYAGSANRAVQIAPEDIPHIKEDLRRDTDISNADKAKKISHLNRTGELIDPDTIYEPYDPLEDLKKKDIFTNKFEDTGREISSFDYGEALDSYVGAPFREIASGIAEGKPRSGLRAAANRFGKDPQAAPTYDNILAKMGMEEGVGRNVAGLAANLLEPGIPGAGLAKMGKLPIAAIVQKIPSKLKRLAIDPSGGMSRSLDGGYKIKYIQGGEDGDAAVKLFNKKGDEIGDLSLVNKNSSKRVEPLEKDYQGISFSEIVPEERKKGFYKEMLDSAVEGSQYEGYAGISSAAQNKTSAGIWDKFKNAIDSKDMPKDIRERHSSRARFLGSSPESLSKAGQKAFKEKQEALIKKRSEDYLKKNKKGSKTASNRDLILKGLTQYA